MGGHAPPMLWRAGLVALTAWVAAVSASARADEPAPAHPAPANPEPREPPPGEPVTPEEAEARAQAAERKAGEALEAGRLEEVEALAREGLRWRERLWNPEDPHWAGYHYSLGTLWERAQQYARAVPHYQRAVDLWTAGGGAPSDLSLALQRWGQCLWRGRRFAEAEAVFQRQLALIEAHPELGEEAQGTAHFNLGVQQEAQGASAQAEASYRRAIALRERAVGAEDEALADYLRVLARLLLWAQRKEEALALLERETRIREALPEGSPTALAQALTERAYALQGLGRAQEGLPLAERALEICRRSFGEESVWTASGQGVLGSLYAEAGRRAEARALLERATATMGRIAGTRNPNAALWEHKLAECCRALGDHEAATRHMRRAIEIGEAALASGIGDPREYLQVQAKRYAWLGDLSGARDAAARVRPLVEREFGPRHPVTLDVLEAEALAILNAGDPQTALLRIERLLALREEQPGTPPEVLARALETCGAALMSLDRNAEALPVVERALALRRAARGSEDGGSIQALRLLVKLESERGDLDRAEALAREVLAIAERHSGEGTALVDALNSLGSVRLEQGALTEARTHLERAVSEAERSLGPEDLKLAAALNQLTQALLALHDVGVAEGHARRALALAEASLEPTNPLLGVYLGNLSAVLVEQGRLEEARRLAERELALRERAAERMPRELVRALNNLATLLGQMNGSSPESLALVERAATLAEQRVPGDPMLIATVLHNLEFELSELGREDEAQRVAERALSVAEAGLGAEHVSLVSHLQGVGIHRQRAGDLVAARACFERARAIAERAGPGYASDVANALNQLAQVDAAEGKPADALARCQQAVALKERALGPDHPLYARSLQNLGSQLAAAKRHAEALEVTERAVAAYERTYGPEHPDTVSASSTLAARCAEAGQPERARELFLRALGAAHRRAQALLPRASGPARLGLLREVRQTLERWLGHSADLGATGYAEVLRVKGLASRAERGERARLAAADPETAALAESLTRAERSRSNLGASVPAARQVEARKAWQEQYARVSQEAERLAQALAQRLSATAGSAARPDTGVAELTAALPPESALVDMLLVQGQYLAWVLTPGGRVVRVRLAGAEELDGAVEAFVAACARGDDDAEAGLALRTLLLEPLVEALGAWPRQLLLCPDAALATVPFTALPGEDPARRLGEDVALVTLTMAQDLPEQAHAAATSRRALLVGAVDYDRADAAVAPGLHVPTPEGAGGASRAPSGMHFDPLPHTLAEVEAVRALLGEGATLVKGAAATEAQVRERARGVRWLHLATHGFVRADLPSALRPTRGDEERWLGAGLERQLTGWDPRLLAGLALAGANPRRGGGDDDGVLTALEVSRLDLAQCEVAVLSACETARGRAQSGEGVIGLVQAFQLAGARSVVASLWPVDDQATRLLMGRFYAALLRPEHPLAPAEALRAASLWLRDAKPEGRDYSAPRYWAAFVCYERR